MTKKPNYRFAGYTEPWEEKKLGEVAELLNGRAYKQEELLEDGEYRVLRVGNFNTNDRWYYSDLQLEDSKYANDGDLLYLWATNFGPELWKEEKVIYHYHIWKIIGYSNILDKYYFYTFLERDKNRIKQNTNGSTMVHITKGMMEERVLTFPSIPEQTAIGSFFQDIDQLISLQQRKLEVLKEQKKTYLKLLFPAKGQTKPALRFAGFEDEWKEVKLGEVTNIKTGSRDVQDSVEDGLYPFYIRSEEVKRINSYSFDGEAILIPGEGRLGEIFHYVNGKFDVHQRVYKISNFTDVNAKFVLQQMKKDFKQHAMRNTVKATVDSLRLPTIQSFTVFVPTLPEQEAIGSFFQDLDKAIAKQEEKVNQLKESKQTLLRKMFI